MREEEYTKGLRFETDPCSGQGVGKGQLKLMGLEMLRVAFIKEAALNYPLNRSQNR